MNKKMMLLVTMIFMMFSVSTFAKMWTNEDGILISDDYDDWQDFFGDNSETGNACTIIGSTIMQMSYNKDKKGDKLANPNYDTQSTLNIINEALAETGEKNPKKGKDYLYESFYANNCKKFTETDYKLVNSETFKNTFQKIFSTYGK